MDLLREVVYETFELDGRAARTIRTLLLKPGILTCDFLAGHRKRYTPPFRLYLVISLLFFVVATWLAGHGLFLEQGQRLETDAPGQARFLSEFLPRLMFVLLPVFAVLLKLAWMRRLYFDHLIFAVHTHCAAYVVLGLMLPFEQAGSLKLALIVQLPLFAYLLVYFVMSVRRVYVSGWFVSGLKSFLILFGYSIVLSAVIETMSSFMIISD